MTTNTIPHPPIVSRDQWLDERKNLLAHEKELTKHRDRINAERRRLPMVKIEKDYVFDGPNGKQGLKALFDGRRQLIVYHFMFDPTWDKGCPGCTSYVSALGDLSLLNDRDTTFVLVSRAPGPQARGLQSAKGMVRPVVLLVWQRLQLRLSRDERREGRAYRIQLSKQGRDGGEQRPQRNGG